MKAPIIISEDGDLSFYKSPENAAKSIEITDIENNLYEIFSANGSRLNPDVSFSEKPILFGLLKIRKENIQLYESTLIEENKLKELIFSFLEVTNRKKNILVEDNLESLIDFCINEFGYDK